MRKMKVAKSIELYRNGIERPWRISLLVFPDGEMAVEMTAPPADIDKARLKTLTSKDYDMLVDMMMRAVHPDRLIRQVERGWE